MKNLIVGNCHNRLWFVLLISLLLSLMFLFFDNSAVTGGEQNGDIFLGNNFVNAIQARKPKSFDFTGSSNDGTITSSTISNSPSEVVVSARQVLLNPTEDKNEANVFAPSLRNQTQKISSPPTVMSNTKPVTKQPKPDFDSCSGRYIYMHHLPSQFNEELLENCHSLVKWINMCQYISNLGLGPRVDNSESVMLKEGWFATNQFMLEVIFHNRMKQYKCLTNDSSLASAIYVPFYAGLDVGRYLWDSNISHRDAASFALVKWLAHRPEWKRNWGRDHFIVGGRIAWDFRRQRDDDSDWGSKLMFLPESKNMTLLTIESSSWDNEFAIPYPTYFHPSKDSQVIRWQKKMRRTRRCYLFCFAGAPRPNSTNSIRSELIDQCRSSSTCNFVDCFNGANKCDDPVNVIKTFQTSVFCLQPAGDSLTRRSTFDSILAGCIPVFFDRGSAYAQYLWHLPKNYTKYSVLIPSNDVKDKKVSVSETLLRVPKNDVLAMREEVIKLIPSIVYADPRSRQETFEDAFDIAVKGVLERVETVRRDLRRIWTVPKVKGISRKTRIADENQNLASEDCDSRIVSTFVQIVRQLCCYYPLTSTPCVN